MVFNYKTLKNPTPTISPLTHRKKRLCNWDLPKSERQVVIIPADYSAVTHLPPLSLKNFMCCRLNTTLPMLYCSSYSCSTSQHLSSVTLILHETPAVWGFLFHLITICKMKTCTQHILATTMMVSVQFKLYSMFKRQLCVLTYCECKAAEVRSYIHV